MDTYNVKLIKKELNDTIITRTFELKKTKNFNNNEDKNNIRIIKHY